MHRARIAALLAVALAAASPLLLAVAADEPFEMETVQLRVEVMTWWYGKGYMTFPKAEEKLPERKAAP
jgi:hypothetical protein